MENGTQFLVLIINLLKARTLRSLLGYPITKPFWPYCKALFHHGHFSPTVCENDPQCSKLFLKVTLKIISQTEVRRYQCLDSKFLENVDNPISSVRCGCIGNRRLKQSTRADLARFRGIPHTSTYSPIHACFIAAFQQFVSFDILKVSDAPKRTDCVGLNFLQM